MFQESHASFLKLQIVVIVARIEKKTIFKIVFAKNKSYEHSEQISFNI